MASPTATPTAPTAISLLQTIMLAAPGNADGFPLGAPVVNVPLEVAAGVTLGLAVTMGTVTIGGLGITTELVGIWIWPSVI